MNKVNYVIKQRVHFANKEFEFYPIEETIDSEYASQMIRLYRVNFPKDIFYLIREEVLDT